MAEEPLAWEIAPRSGVPRAGETFAGRFVLEALLGRGGMGMVFRAREVESGRAVALKLLTGARAERLEREGELTARLRHPGIVQVHSAGVADGTPWLAYELVGVGRTLEGALPGLGALEGVRLLHQVALAVGHAHARGVVHRDLKPSNVLLDEQGRPRVADFGLARAAGLSPLTGSGVLVGTPRFASPEQADGVASVGPPADVWALGVMLYRVLTGRLPFEAAELPGLLDEIRRQAPPRPRTLAPDLSPALEAICLRALAKSPAERYPDAGALAADLGAWLAGEAPAAPARRRAALMALGALALVAAALAARSAAPDAAAPEGAASAASATPDVRAPSLTPLEAQLAGAARAMEAGADPEPWLAQAAALSPHDPRLIAARARAALAWAGDPELALDLLGEREDLRRQDPVAADVSRRLLARPLDREALRAGPRLAARCLLERARRDVIFALALEDPRLGPTPAPLLSRDARLARARVDLELALALVPPGSDEEPGPRALQALERASAGDAQEALARLGPGAPSGGALGRLARLGRARELVRAGSPSGAIPDLRALLGDPPLDPGACELLVAALAADGREAEARALDPLLGRLRAPRHEEALARLAAVDTIDGQDPAAVYQEVLALDPFQHDARSLRGGLLVQGGEVTAGLRQLSLALRLRPRLATQIGRRLVRGTRKPITPHTLERLQAVFEAEAPDDLLMRAFLASLRVEHEARADLLEVARLRVGSALEEDPACVVAWGLRAFLDLRAGLLRSAERDLVLVEETGLDPILPAFLRVLLLAARRAPADAVRAQLARARAHDPQVLVPGSFDPACYPELAGYEGLLSPNRSSRR